MHKIKKGKVYVFTTYMYCTYYKYMFCFRYLCSLKYIHTLLNNKLNSIENLLFIIRCFKMYHNFCTPDIFNTKNSHQFFEYKITYVSKNKSDSVLV